MGPISALMSREVLLRQLCLKNQVQSTWFRWTLLKMQNQLNNRTGHNISDHSCDSEEHEDFCCVFLIITYEND